MSEISFKSEGIEVEIRGDDDKVAAMAMRLQSSQPVDTLGRILSINQDPEAINALVDALGGKEKEAGKIMNVLRFLTGWIKK
jgi:hypothetical protein